jgi:hypothetical protein
MLKPCLRRKKSCLELTDFCMRNAEEAMREVPASQTASEMILLGAETQRSHSGSGPQISARSNAYQDDSVSSRKDGAGTIAIRSANLRRLGTNQHPEAKQIPKPEIKSSMIASPISSMTSLRGHTSGIGSAPRVTMSTRNEAEENYLFVRASTPGSFLPSRNSSDAPPPVEI